MPSISVTEKLLSDNDFVPIQSVLMGENFPWFTTFKCYDIARENATNIQFVHNFYSNEKPFSSYFDLLKPIFDKINVRSLVRVKANLQPRTHERITYGMHTDNDLNCNTAIYYINTNNGETLFENKQTVTSEENKIVVFPSHFKHAATTNTCDKKYRIVLNLNYF